jgi:NAD(P)-dependent dehydrogenase (short-subunit alcohol dehydrogenase family)
MEIQEKVVIITGASTGIGLAAARLFTQRGAKVAMVARSVNILERLASELPGSLAVPADLSDVEHVPQVIDAIYEHYGRVDVLINNAGRAFHTPVEHADVQLYRHLLDLNLVSVLIAMQCVIPIMRAQGSGVIINISSGLTRRIVPGVGPYASTKYALNALTLTARAELAADNIHVGLVFPGRTINTNFGQNAIAGTAGNARPQASPQAAAGTASAGLPAAYPPMRVDRPEEVAEKILEAVQTEAAETYTASTQG